MAGTKINRDSEKTEPSFKSGGPEDKTGRKQDFTQGNIVKQIVAFTLPLIASSLLQALYNMVDISSRTEVCRCQRQFSIYPGNSHNSTNRVTR